MENQKIAKSNIDTLNLDVLKIFNQLSQASDNRVSYYLIGFGSILIVFSLLIRLQILCLCIPELLPRELISVIVASSIFIIVGVLLRFYVYKNIYELTKSQQKFGSTIIKDTLETIVENKINNHL